MARSAAWRAWLALLVLSPLSLVHCASREPAWVAPVIPKPLPLAAAGKSAPLPAAELALPSASSRVPQAEPPPAEPSPPAALDADEAEPPPAAHCADAPTLLADGSVPPVPPHAPLGQDLDVPGDRPAYVLPGTAGDSRVIVYLHGMCGDVTAADFFREAVRAHGTLIAVRGDTACENGRFKWRDDASKIQARIRAAFKQVNAVNGGQLTLDGALLFGYSQGAERAERVAARFPDQYPRLVLGGPPTKASPLKLARAQRVAILGGELETTENMRAGFDALLTAGIRARFFTLDCAYHGYFGSNAEGQLGEVLDWVTAHE
jgi:predicted esterase